MLIFLVLAAAAEVNTLTINATDIPMIVDYRNVTSAVKEQGACGACWAFATLEAVELLATLQGKALNKETFSVQHVIDCSGISYGCSGGDIRDSVDYLQATGYKFVAQNGYSPYTGEKQDCRKQVKRTTNITITASWCENYANKEETLLKLIATGPVIATVDSTYWRDYLGGVIRYHCEAGKKDHAVVIVGYNLEADPQFYIVKNSWGSKFGDNGYLYIAIGENLCGIADKISRVTID